MLVAEQFPWHERMDILDPEPLQGLQAGFPPGFLGKMRQPRGHIKFVPLAWMMEPGYHSTDLE